METNSPHILWLTRQFNEIKKFNSPEFTIRDLNSKLFRQFNINDKMNLAITTDNS